MDARPLEPGRDGRTPERLHDLEAGAIQKFLIINVLATIVLLLTYALFVRNTPIGWLLNGRRGRVRRGSSR